MKSGSWGEFCRLLLDCFGRDQHELLLRQLLHIHQPGSVQEYVDKFTELVDQLLAYGKNTDPLFYAMKFIDGLCDEIRSAVHLQRPTSLDTAVVLALLQEELVDPSRHAQSKKSEPFAYARPPVHGALPLPPPPGADRGARPMGGADERRARVPLEDKLATLHNHRRDRGLCIRCSEKWSRGHRCPENIQLNVLQEVWELCHSDCEFDVIESEETVPHLYAVETLAATSDQLKDRAILLSGSVQGQLV